MNRMTLKGYAAIVTGALAMVLTALLLWIWTRLPLQDVAAVSLAAYYAGIVSTFAAIDRLEKRHRRSRNVQIITLDRNEWERGRDAS